MSCRLRATWHVSGAYVSLEGVRGLGACGGRVNSALSRINVLIYNKLSFTPTIRTEYRAWTAAPRVARMLPITHVIAHTSLGTLGDGAGSWRACGTLNRMHRINTRKRRQGHTGRTCELLQRC